MGSQPDHSTGPSAGLRRTLRCSKFSTRFASRRSGWIRPTITRGQLWHVVAGVGFTSFAQAASAWSAVQAHRPGNAAGIDQLTVVRIAAIVGMHRAGDDLPASSTATKLFAQLRQLRPEGGVA